MSRVIGQNNDTGEQNSLTAQGSNNLNFGLARDQTASEVGQRFSLAIINQEKGFIIAKAYQINKGENLNILCLQVLIWRQNGSSAFGNSIFDRCRQVGK